MARKLVELSSRHKTLSAENALLQALESVSVAQRFFQLIHYMCYIRNISRSVASIRFPI